MNIMNPFVKNYNKTIITVAIIIFGSALSFYLRQAIMPFALAAIISYLCVPIVDFAEKKGVARWASSALLTVVIASILLTFAIIVVPIMLHKLLALFKSVDLSRHEIKDQVHMLLAKLKMTNMERQESMLDTLIDNSLSEIKAQGTEFIMGMLQSSVKLINIMVTMLLVPILTYYMLRDWSEVISAIRSLIPVRYMGIVDEIFGGISDNISKYLHGQAKVCLILMVLYSSILVANRLHFGLMIGMSIGAFAFVPFIGFITGLAVAAYVAFQQFGDTTHVMMVVVSMLVGQFIDSNFVTPKIIGSSLDLSPSWMIFGLMSSFLVFGVVGALFALPIVVVGTVLVRAAIKFYKSTSYYVHAK